MLYEVITGLRIFDVKDKQNIVELYHFDNMEAYDVIRDEDRALVIGETGFVQYKLEGNVITSYSIHYTKLYDVLIV